MKPWRSNSKSDSFGAPFKARQQFTLDDVTGRTSFQTETILQGVKVLAVGSSMGPEETTGTAQKKADNQRRAARSSATLELTLERPDESEETVTFQKIQEQEQ